jgi:hypothetical protein
MRDDTKHLGHEQDKTRRKKKGGDDVQCLLIICLSMDL